MQRWLLRRSELTYPGDILPGFSRPGGIGSASDPRGSQGIPGIPRIVGEIHVEKTPIGLVPSGERFQKAMDNHHTINGKIHYKLPFSIAMLVHQRVAESVPSGKRLQFANLKMAIEIVSFPIKNGDFP